MRIVTLFALLILLSTVIADATLKESDIIVDLEGVEGGLFETTLELNEGQMFNLIIKPVTSETEPNEQRVSLLKSGVAVSLQWQSDEEPQFKISWDDSIALDLNAIPIETEEVNVTISGTTDDASFCKEMRPGAVSDFWEKEENCVPKLSISVNGEVVDIYAKEDGMFSKSVELEKGANTITVTATDPGGNTNTETVTVTYNPPIFVVLQENIIFVVIAVVVVLLLMILGAYMLTRRGVTKAKALAEKAVVSGEQRVAGAQQVAREKVAKLAQEYLANFNNQAIAQKKLEGIAELAAELIRSDPKYAALIEEQATKLAALTKDEKQAVLALKDKKYFADMRVRIKGIEKELVGIRLGAAEEHVLWQFFEKVRHEIFEKWKVLK